MARSERLRRAGGGVPAEEASPRRVDRASPAAERVQTLLEEYGAVLRRLLCAHGRAGKAYVVRSRRPDVRAVRRQSTSVLAVRKCGLSGVLMYTGPPSPWVECNV